MTQVNARSHLGADLLGVLEVELIQRLDVVAGEGDRNEEDVFSATTGQSTDRLVSAGTQPRQRANLEQREVDPCTNDAR